MTLKTLVIAAGILAGTSTSALSHATFAEKTAEQNSTYKAVINIAHGCGDEATLKVRVTIPEGIISVKPKNIAGWTLETVNGDYAKTYEYHGPKSSGVQEIIWTGELATDHFEEFIFRARVTDAFEVGSKVYFPVVQECATGENPWVEIPVEGSDKKLDHPAPALTIEEGHSGHH